MIDTKEYIKVLKSNEILQHLYTKVHKERIAIEDAPRQIFFGIILYLYIISNTEGELVRRTNTKIKHIKLIRDCTRENGNAIMSLRTAKELVETLVDLNFINVNPNYDDRDIKDIGICLRDELIDCISGNFNTMMAKYLLLEHNKINHDIKAYLFSR